MEKRPLSLTIIGWWLVLGGVFGLYSTLTMSSNPISAQMLEKSGLPIAVAQANGVIGCIIGLACAYGIFKALPWSRVLYVGWGVLSTLFMIVFMPMISIIVLNVIFLAVIAYFLFRPAADQWFGARGLSLQRQG